MYMYNTHMYVFTLGWSESQEYMYMCIYTEYICKCMGICM